MKTIFKKERSLFCTVCVAMVIALFLAACSDKNEPTELSPAVLENPLKPDDYVTVPTTGGTITKEDVVINIPEGTFDKAEKVGLTKVTKDTIAVEDKVSDFYYMELPADANEPLTISLKSEKLADDDVYLVTYVPSHSLHNPDSITYAPISYKATYENGEYKATLPAFENDGASGSVNMSVGLAHMMELGSGAQNAPTRVNMEGGTEGNISWHFEIGPLFYWANHGQLTIVVADINEYMHDAVKKITDLKFSVLEKRDIPILFSSMGPGEWGLFKQHPTNDSKSWIELSKTMVTSKDIDKDEVKQTIIHELFHYFQAEYDTRLPINKFRLCNGDELLMYESGGRWIEKFMNNGVPPIKDYKDRLPFFVRALDNIEEVYQKDTDSYSEKFASTIVKFFGGKGSYFDIGKARQTHGYAMGALLEYFSKQYGDKSIVELYEDWTRNSMNMMNINMQSTMLTLRNYANAKNSDLFMGGYDKFLVELITGRLIPGLKSSDLGCRVEGQITPKVLKKEIKSECYPLGADVQFVTLRFEEDELPLIKGKEIVIKNESDKESTMHTYVVSHKRNSDYMYEEPLWPQDSIVIPGDSIMLLKGDTRIYGTGYVLMTSSYAGKKSGYKLKVEMRNIVKAMPDSLDFEAEGGTQSTFLDLGDFAFYGADVNSAGASWCRAVKVGSSGEVQITAQPNLTKQSRECVVECWVSDESYPLDKEKIVIPVKVTQQAGGDISAVEIDYFRFSAELKSQYTWTYNGTAHPQDIGSTYYGFNSQASYEHPNSITVTNKLNGTTLHVEATEKYDYTDDYTGQPTGGYYSNSISFDLVNFTGDFKSCKVTNLVCKTVNYSSEDEHNESEVKLTNIPYEYFYARNPKISYLEWNQLSLKGTRTSGVQVTSSSATSTWRFYDDTPVSSTMRLIPDDTDTAELQIYFKPVE